MTVRRPARAPAEGSPAGGEEVDPAGRRFWSLRVYTASVLIWTGTQALSIALPALGWTPEPFTPAEQYTCHSWVISQWIILAVALTELLPTAATAISLVLLLWPYAALASLLGGTIRATVAVAVCQSVWVMVLAGAQGIMRAGQRRPFAALFRFWILGGAMLAYLEADQAPIRHPWLLHLDPLFATVNGLHGVLNAETVITQIGLAIITVIASFSMTWVPNWPQHRGVSDC